MRRTSTFNASTFPINTQTLARKITTIAALVLVSICLGAAGTYTVIQNDEDPLQQTIRIERARFELDLTMQRLSFTTESLAEATAQYEAGALSIIEVQQLQAQEKLLTITVLIAEQNLAEIQLSEKDPNDHLSAPLVAGKDFVKSRLTFRLDAAVTEFESAQTHLDRLQTLVNAGTISDRELNQAQTNLLMLERKLAEVEGQLELRKQFIAGTINGPAVELTAQQNKIENQTTQIALQLQATDEQISQLQRLIENGVVSARELRALELQRKQLAQQYTLNQMESDLIQKQIAAQAANEDAKDQ